jgi:vitamin B12 transporter
MRSFLLTTAALAAFVPYCAHAETAVDELIVTATRLPTRLDMVTGAHVIDRAELDARQTAFAEDILATIPGVGITRQGDFGGLATIRIRGASPDKTLVLIDGAPVNDASDPSGAFDPSSLQTTDLERIEVLSGPQGSLWGSDAIGGVVAFTTRETQGWRAEAEGGSLGTARGSLAAGVSEDTYAVNGSVAAYRTDGVSKAASGTEKDGFRTWTATLGGRATLSDNLRLDGRLHYTDSNVAIDGYPPPTYVFGDTPDRNKTRAWSGFARASFDALGLKQAVSFSDYRIARDNISSFPYAYVAERQVYRWTAEREGVVLGAERTATTADLDSRPSTDIATNSVFAVARNQVVPFLTLTGSLRYDDPDKFKARTTGRLAAAATLGAGFTLTVSAGQGFKTPTISEAICDFCFATPVALVPERSVGYDARLGWTSGDGRISAAVTAYRLNVRDQIMYVASRYINVARTRSKGLEGEADIRFSDAVRLKLAYAWLDAADATTGASLLRNPDRSGAATLLWDQDAWGGALTVRGESSQADTATDGFSRAIRPGFVVADLAGSYRLNPKVTLTARIENLTDKRYQESLGYGEAGRAVYVGVRLRN